MSSSIDLMSGIYPNIFKYINIFSHSGICLNLQRFPIFPTRILLQRGVIKSTAIINGTNKYLFYKTLFKTFFRSKICRIVKHLLKMFLKMFLFLINTLQPLFFFSKYVKIFIDSFTIISALCSQFFLIL